MAFDFDELEEIEKLATRDKDVELAPPAPRMKSRARTWFEIRRFFEADARSSPNALQHCARDLLLKTIHERLHKDGFVVIQCQLPQKTAQDLCHMLCGTASNSNTLDCGWVGSKYLRDRSPQVASQIAPNGQGPVQCEVTFCWSGERQVLKPSTKLEFMSSLKAFLHAVAASAESSETSKVPATFAFGERSSAQLEDCEAVAGKVGWLLQAWLKHDAT